MMKNNESKHRRPVKRKNPSNENNNIDNINKVNEYANTYGHQVGLQIGVRVEHLLFNTK